MNKELINKVLIVFVIGIWIVILFKFFNKEKTMSNVPVTDIETKNDFYLKKRVKEDFKLFFPKKDPFLGKYFVEKFFVTKKRTKKRVKKRTKILRWPNIKYLGTIKKEDGTQLALLKIRGSFVKIKKRELYKEDDFYVEKMYKDSVLLIKNKIKKIIKVNRK